jgi:hypothetical protein
MAGWEDVVTAGLIGTDRRPVPDNLPPSWATQPDPATDPAHAVLSLAARHRAVTRAGALPAFCPPAALGPPNPEPVAGRAAHEILDRVMSPPQVDLLNLWLVAAAQHGQEAAASYWTPLAMVAARTSAVDRTSLGRALGERGRWFVAQNPEWTRLSSSLEPAMHDDLSPDRTAPSGAVNEDAVLADPELILRVTEPWSQPLTEAVLEIIGSGRLGESGRHYAATVGARMPLEHYDELLRSAVARRLGSQEPLTGRTSRSVREAFQALERVMWARTEMESAFAGKPIMLQRIGMPPW